MEEAKDIEVIAVNQHISLRSVRKEDADPIFQLIDQSRSYMEQWLGWVSETHSASDTLAFINFANSRKGKDMFVYCIWLKDEIAGLIDLHQINWFARNAAIGYWLGKNYQGSGIMINSCSRLIQFAFHQMELQQITIKCALENKKSRCIPEKLSFKYAGIERGGDIIDNQLIDLAVYKAQKEEWKMAGPE